MKHRRYVAALLLGSVSAVCLTLSAQADPGFNDIGNVGVVQPQTFVSDLSGNLYGSAGNGIFELSGPNHQTISWVTTALGPTSQLTVDNAGNLYGTARVGGTYREGSVFEFSGASHQMQTTLFSFSPTDAYGDYPQLPVVFDNSGNIFGVTGTDNAITTPAFFELSGAAHQTFQYRPQTLFPDGICTDQYGNLIAISDSITELTPHLSNVITLHNLNFSTEGYTSLGGLTTDAAGNIYGTLNQGGPGNGGSVFEISGANHQNFTILATFNGSNGSSPEGGVTIDANGDIWGTTRGGGLYGGGIVYELSGPTHQTLTTKFSYDGRSDVGNLEGGLAPDANGNLFGEADIIDANGAYDSDIFEITNTGFAVPEPSTLSLLAIGTLPLLRRRRVQQCPADEGRK